MGNSMDTRSGIPESAEPSASSSTAHNTAEEVAEAPETTSPEPAPLPPVQTRPSRVSGTRRTKKVKKKDASLYADIRGGRRRGNIGPDFYNNLNLTIQQAVHELDTNEPEKILDLCLIMDCTGSMSSWMAHCKDTLKDVIDDTIKKDPDCKVRVSFVGFRDFCDGDIFAIHDFSYDAEAVKTFMNGQRATGGGDTPEDVQGGLRKALDLNWMPLEDSIKLAFLCADAPCHGKRYHSCMDDYPDGNPCGVQLEALLKEFSDREILLTCYKITDHTETMFDMFPGLYDAGKEKDGVEFIDIRGQVKSSQSMGVSLHSTAMRDCYATTTMASRSVQVSKHRSRKRGW